MRCLVCYDIGNPKRLHAIAKAMEKYGLRIQKSFFCCDAEGDDLIRMRMELLPILNVKEDRLAFFSICDKCFSERYDLGKPIEMQTPDYLIL